MIFDSKPGQDIIYLRFDIIRINSRCGFYRYFSDGAVNFVFIHRNFNFFCQIIQGLQFGCVNPLNGLPAQLGFEYLADGGQRDHIDDKYFFGHGCPLSYLVFEICQDVCLGQLDILLQLDVGHRGFSGVGVGLSHGGSHLNSL